MGFRVAPESDMVAGVIHFMTVAMKTLAFVLSIMTAGMAMVVAQQAPAPPVETLAAANGVGPKIQFATPVYDFGRVRAGEPARHTYVFTNTGDALLIIKNVQPQCGCTTAGSWTKEVEPGQTGSIPIQFNTAGYNGPVFKQITVNCNVTNQPAIFLQIKGTIYKPIEMIPPMTILNVPPDADMVSGVVAVTNNTDEPLVLSAPESNNRMFAAELKTNVPGKAYQLTISTVPPLSMGTSQGQITLRTGWTNPPTVNVPVMANVQPTVLVIPTYMTLAPGPLEKAVTNSISIRNQGTNDVRLSDPVVNVAGPTAEIREMQAGKSFAAMVAFPQGFLIPPGQRAELSFKTSHPKYPVIKVPIMQMPRPAPPPAVNPQTPPPASPPAVSPQPPRPARPAAVNPPPLPPPLPLPPTPK